MCSLSSHHKLVMNDYAAVGGDLTDIFQAGDLPVSDVKVGALPSSSLTASWGDLASISCNSNVVGGEDFGDPFSDTGDPLLRDGDAPPPFTLPYVEGEGEGSRRAERIKAPFSYGVFSRILQITTAPSEASPLGDNFSYANGPSLLTSTMTEDHGMMRISSPRNNPSMKRRKIQGKKVVCIPSPAAVAANSRREVVPSDLWAWRKYGQKPIKGSPFPRGYYRCSSSKGCSARKQVERSQTDPNMLVITYTSEHNHPWPSHRNALAGLTRLTSKGSSGSKNSANSSRTVKSDFIKGEKHNGNPSDDNMPCTAAVAGESSDKEEMDNVWENPFDAEDAEFVGVGLTHCHRPSLMDRADYHPDDFFAALGEIEADPYELLFKQGFLGNDRNRGNMSMEHPFNLVDWADDGNGLASFCEANNKGL